MHTILWLFPKFAAALFAVAGFVLFANPEPVSRLLGDWGYGRNFNRVFGFFSVLSAVLLLIPQLQLWGVAVAAFVLFGTTIALLERRQYLYAAPAIFLLGTLPLSFALG